MITKYLYELYRTDQILADTEMNYFSMKPEYQSQKDQLTGFDLCSDRMAKSFNTYTFDEVGRMIPNENARLINYNQLRELLLSTNLSREESLFWQTNNGPKYLDCEDDL